MNHNTLGRFGGWALLLLAATQGLLLGLRPWSGGPEPPPGGGPGRRARPNPDSAPGDPELLQVRRGPGVPGLLLSLVLLVHEQLCVGRRLPGRGAMRLPSLPRGR